MLVVVVVVVVLVGVVVAVEGTSVVVGLDEARYGFG